MKRFSKINNRNKGYMKSFVPSFGDAIQIDQAIYQLAAYASVRGLLVIPESQDQSIDLQKRVAKRFNYFKRLIQNSEMSLFDLQKSIIERDGPFPSKKHNLTMEQSIEQVIKESQKRDNDPPQVVTNILHKLFEDIIKTSEQEYKENITGMIEEPENSDEVEEIEEPNPFLFPQIRTHSDSIPLDNRGMPKLESGNKPTKDTKSKKGKNGRNTSSKTKKNPKGKRNT